jgi:HlyD family secretion protein
MKRLRKNLLSAVLLLALAGAAVYVLRPKPLEVDTARAAEGSLQVTIDEDGQTRARDQFTLAAPVSGLLSRIELREGDAVTRGQALATVSPLPLDTRTETAIRAQIAAAEASEREAAHLVARAESALEQARRDLARAAKLYKTDAISRQQYEDAQTKEEMLARDLEAAKLRASAAAAETARVRAGLISASSAGVATIRAPFNTRILRIFEKSERVVNAGTPILLLSNPGRLEIVADLLSTDAVNVHPGDPVWVENWGGKQPLRARIRTVEPYGFTKVSALGVEEQRVNVIADFLDRPANLGDGYRVDLRIVVWEGDKVLKVPASALFRSGTEWNVFVVEGNAARRRAVTVGHRNAEEAEILGGLEPGTEVILHPSNQVKDGAPVKRRAPAESRAG